MIGTSLSHYRIADKLGVGGMGDVYRAEDTNLNRQVTIKVLPGRRSRTVGPFRTRSQAARIVHSSQHRRHPRPGGIRLKTLPRSGAGRRADARTPAGPQRSLDPRRGSRRIISTQKPGEIETGLQARTLKRKPRLPFLATISSPRTDIATTVRMRSVFQ